MGRQELPEVFLDLSGSAETWGDSFCLRSPRREGDSWINKTLWVRFQSEVCAAGRENRAARANSTRTEVGEDPGAQAGRARTGVCLLPGTVRGAQVGR